MLKRIQKASVAVTAFMISSAPMWAAGGGRLAATQAINGLAGEVSGPLAYGISLTAVTVAAISWYRHHHDMSGLGQGALGTLFVAGVALGGASLLGFVPGVAGALI